MKKIFTNFGNFKIWIGNLKLAVTKHLIYRRGNFVYLQMSYPLRSLEKYTLVLVCLGGH